jgi:hypothetical protein
MTGIGFMRRQGCYWITSGRVYLDFMQKGVGCDDDLPPLAVHFLSRLPGYSPQGSAMGA